MAVSKSSQSGESSKRTSTQPEVHPAKTIMTGNRTSPAATANSSPPAAVAVNSSIASADGVDSAGSATLAHLQKLTADPAIKPRSVLDFERQAFSEGDEHDEEGYESSGYLAQLIGGCKSWMVSMVLHLIVILTLAAITLQAGKNRTVSLVVSSDEFSSMMDMEELQFESDFESFDQAEEQPQELQMASLEDFQLELELPEFDDSAADFSDPLASDSDLAQRLSREMTSDELEAGVGESSFFGIAADGDVVFIVDRSGSMQGFRWQAATNELNKAIQALKPDQNFYVFLFSSGTHPMPRMGAKRNELVPATDENKQKFEKWLRRQFPSGSTKPLASIRRAMNMNPDSMFVLTDGNFYDDTYDYLLKYAEKQDKRSDPDDIVINTIGFFCGQRLEEMLNDIALAFSGTFRSVTEIARK